MAYIHGNQNSYTGQQVIGSQLIKFADDEWRVSGLGNADRSAQLALGLGSGVGRGAGSCGRWQVCHVTLYCNVYTLRNVSSHCMIRKESTPRGELAYLMMMVIIITMIIEN